MMGKNFNAVLVVVALVFDGMWLYRIAVNEGSSGAFVWWVIVNGLLAWWLLPKIHGRAS